MGGQECWSICQALFSGQDCYTLTKEGEDKWMLDNGISELDITSNLPEDTRDPKEYILKCVGGRACIIPTSGHLGPKGSWGRALN